MLSDMSVSPGQTSLPISPATTVADRRKACIKELVDTERAYVDHLNHMIKGYIKHMRPLVGNLFDEDVC